MLDVIIVRIENYRGLQYFEELLQTVRHGGQVVDLRNVVPVAPMKATDDDPPARGRRGGGAHEADSAQCFRTQLPLMLAFAFHKTPRVQSRPRRCRHRLERTDGRPGIHGVESVPRTLWDAPRNIRRRPPCSDREQQILPRATSRTRSPAQKIELSRDVRSMQRPELHDRRGCQAYSGREDVR